MGSAMGSAMRDAKENRLYETSYKLIAISVPRGDLKIIDPR
jgi:hypothetical protein